MTDNMMEDALEMSGGYPRSGRQDPYQIVESELRIIRHNRDSIELHDAVGRVMGALAAAGYAVVKADPQDDQVARALEKVGWVLVPVEPTEAMRDAGVDAWEFNEGQEDEDVRRVYKAMLAAAKGEA